MSACIDRGDLGSMNTAGLTVTVVFVKPSNCWRSYMVDMEGAVSPGGSPRKLEARRRAMGLSFFDVALRLAVVAWVEWPGGFSSADEDVDVDVDLKVDMVTRPRKRIQ